MSDDRFDADEQTALLVIAKNTPIGFWKGFMVRARSAYADAFSAVKADTQLNHTQRMSKLYQERHYKLEWLLINEASVNKIEASDRVIMQNRCAYAFAATNAVSMTQKYVRNPGNLPPPSQFRKQLAATTHFHKRHGLMFGDDPQGLFLPKTVNGIVLHSPIGRSFDSEQQRLGSIGFYVPHSDYSGWAVCLSFAQIISAYDSDAVREDKAHPKRKQRRQDDDSAESAA